MQTGFSKTFTVRTQEHEFQATENHPVLLSSGKWQRLGQLTTGDHVLSPIDLKSGAGASESRVMSIVSQDAVPVYDIEVAEGHSFVAGGVLVHNSHVSFWDASTSGTFLGSDALETSRGVTAGDNFTIATGDLDLALTPIAA